MTEVTELSRPQGEALHTKEVLLNLGPQHPSTHGVLRLVLELDGECGRGRAVAGRPLAGVCASGGVFGFASDFYCVDDLDVAQGTSLSRADLAQVDGCCRAGVAVAFGLSGFLLVIPAEAGIQCLCS